jgi:plastocyanin
MTWRKMIRVLITSALPLALPCAVAAEDHVVAQREKAFSEQRITLRAGDRILFKNEDSVSHNVFSTSPGFEFQVRVQLPGQETPVSFSTAGAIEVRCAIHPGMRLQVTVIPKE